MMDQAISSYRLSSGLREVAYKILAFYMLFYSILLQWLSVPPKAFFNPPVLSFAYLFDSPLSAVTVKILLVLFTVSSYLIFINKYRRINLLISFLLLTMIQNFHYSFGKIDHLFLLNFLVFSLFISDDFSFGKIKIKGLKIEQSIFSFCLILALSMITAGFKKSFVWIDFDPSTSGFLSWWIFCFYSLERNELLASVATHFPRLVLEVLDYSAILLEFLGVFILFRNINWFFIWVVFLTLFHALNLLFLNISFLPHIPVYLVLSLAYLSYNGYTFSVRLKTLFSGTFSIFPLVFVGLSLLCIFSESIFNLVLSMAGFVSGVWFQLFLWLALLGFFFHCIWVVYHGRDSYMLERTQEV